MKIFVTGADGFIARNLIFKLKESKKFNITTSNRSTSYQEYEKLLVESDFIFHIAGENRSKNNNDFEENNFNLTKTICEIIKKNKIKAPLLFTSTTQVGNGTIYGDTKLKSEHCLESLHHDNSNNIVILRLNGVFGKWCKPNYNSVVATFCFNAINNLKSEIIEGDRLLRLSYIDDVVEELSKFISNIETGFNIVNINSFYEISVNELHKNILKISDLVNSGCVNNVGSGIERALYSTYLSYLPKESFSGLLDTNDDQRGRFVELLKTQNSGQFSYFTAKPGVTRGGHYHHTKNEKFFVVFGNALFNFKNILTGESFQIEASDNNPSCISTIPGWAHDITNIGESDLIVLLWANEIFDQKTPDTFSYNLKNEKA